jgi:sec-independent protein translocase protein TatA
MPGFIGVPELLIVLAVVLIIFGPKRLPQLGRSLGGGMREFKDSVTGRHGNDDDDEGKVIETPKDKNVSTAAADKQTETETARAAREAKTADAS